MSDNVRLSYEKSLKDLERLVNGLRESFESMRIMEAKEVTESRLRFSGLETRMVVLSRQVESLKDKPMDELKLREIIDAEIKFQLSKIGLSNIPHSPKYGKSPVENIFVPPEELGNLFKTLPGDLKIYFSDSPITGEKFRTLFGIPSPADKGEFLNFLDSLKEQIEEDDDEEEDDNDGGCYDCQHTPTSEELAIYKRVKDYLEC